MMSRFFAILLAAILAVHAVYGAVGDVAVLCFGGGHQHAPSEAEHCETACNHDGTMPQPVSSDSHSGGCGCTDVELTIVDFVTLPSSDDGFEASQDLAPAPAWSHPFVESGPLCRGPSMQALTFDPGGIRRLAVVASVRLTT